ncbi:hypothetical protein KUM39_21230 [Streptomyces sp. J2-1]|nr:hypothetical protein [Streptomyces corallincola]
MTTDGRVAGAIMVCGHHIDGASAYVDGPGSAQEKTLGDWESKHPLHHGLTLWPLDAEEPAATPSWRTRTPLTPLRPHTAYTLYGWTRDNSWSAAEVTFTRTDLTRLSPGTIPYTKSTETADYLAAVPAAEFAAKTCEHM